jgi:hypothetical protein
MEMLSASSCRKMQVEPSPCMCMCVHMSMCTHVCVVVVMTECAGNRADYACVCMRMCMCDYVQLLRAGGGVLHLQTMSNIQIYMLLRTFQAKQCWYDAQ